MNKIFLAILFSLSLSACGGGGGGAPAPVVPVVVNEDANGIWEGTFTDGAAAFAIGGLIYEGTIIALSTEANALYVGTYSVVGDNFTASVTVYEIGGTVLGTASLVGVVTEQSQLSLTYTTSYGSSGSISIFYDNVYDRNSSFATLAGNYSRIDNSLNLTIQGDGSFSGIDTDGCQIDGNFLILDPNFNLYRITAVITLCGLANGSYTGFAGLSDFVGINDALTVALSNDNFVFIACLLR
jgi:hypothetical protein